MTAREIIDIYISFFEKRGHTRIPGASLVPLNDPTTLFTSSGMQPLVPYLLGEQHPAGTRLVDVQNSFRAVDIDEVGNNRHTTFFRMLGNWSLGDYFKKEQLPWFFEFLTKELGIDPKRLYVTTFVGNEQIEKDETSYAIWQELFSSVGLDPKERIFSYGVEKNWWSRSGIPEKMPAGEPGGPDSEVFYDFGEELHLHEQSQWKNEKCHVNCDCGRYWEIGNSVFMQYLKQEDGSFINLPKQNVDFGGGLERLIGATENQPDMFMTSLFYPTIQTIEKQTNKVYQDNKKAMQIIADHLGASCFIALDGIKPANKEQGYILRRLLRRSFDYFYQLYGTDITPILETIVTQYKETDPDIFEQFETLKLIVLEEEQKYQRTRSEAKKYIDKKYKSKASSVKREDEEGLPTEALAKAGDELMGTTEISADDAFILYTTHGLSPTQIESLGYTFDRQTFAQKMGDHQKLSRTASAGKFKGGLADHEELTIKGHTATHLLQQALRDVLGNHVFQTGSNITTERLRFDFSHPDKLTDEQIEKVQSIVREKIKEDLPVHFEMLPLKEAKATGAIGLFDEKYQEKVKVYFIGDYSKEFCGGPHVERTGQIKSFEIFKQEKLGQGQMRIYARVE